MYTVSEVITIGQAHELILSEIKVESLIDDVHPNSMVTVEQFDE